MKSIKSRLAAFTVGAALLASSLVGCGGGGDVTYAPAAYGETIGGIGHCYWVEDPGEISFLYAANLCPHTWVAVQAPLYWRERYYAYYSSPAYYTHYVPVGSRTVFISSERSFGVTYRTQITVQSRTATYRGSNGKTYSGSKVGSTKVGSGTSFGGTGQKFGGGSRGGSGSNGGTKVGGNTGSRSGGGSGSRGFSGGFGGGSRGRG